MVNTCVSTHMRILPEREFSSNPFLPRFWFQSWRHDDPKAILNHQRLNYVNRKCSEMYFILF